MGEETLFEQVLRLAQPRCPHSSSFLPIRRSNEALDLRLGLADTAQRTLDAQYYIWKRDEAGYLLAQRLLHAADRGVKVRLLLDDINVHGSDWNISVLDSHPNIEVKLYNPFRTRTQLKLLRAMEFFLHIERLNRRMHNKLFIADDNAGIIGGRNIGNEYFGINSAINFRDLDVMAKGPIVGDMVRSFESYWHDEAAHPIGWMTQKKPKYKDLIKARREINQYLAKKKDRTKAFFAEVRDWSDHFDGLQPRFLHGHARMIDTAEGPTSPSVQQIKDMVNNAREDVLIVSPYIVPNRAMLRLLKELTARGTRVRILTNSLASNDVIIANTCYRRYRKKLLRAGVELYELRADADDRCDYESMPVMAKRSGLHAKAIIVDRVEAFVGTLNLDQRSIYLNTESGLVMNSPELATQLLQHFERDLLPKNSWRVRLDQRKRLFWESEAGVTFKQPAHSFLQRVFDFIYSPIAFEQHI